MEEDDSRPTFVDIAPPEPSSKHCADACLVEIYGRQLGRRIDLGQADMVCGRDGECQVQLDDHKVSRRHALFRRTGQGFAVQDLGSTNGTFVNNNSVQAHELAHGDQVKMGHTIFRFLCAGTTEAQYHEVIHRLMTHDGLTEAYNRQAFEQGLAQEVGRARRYGRPLSLMMFDLDHFKEINDEHGHMAGDEVLRQFAALVTRSIRQEDLFGRLGGEEFAVLVPESDLRSCRDLAERLRQLVETTELQVEGKTIRLTCSFGVAELDVAEDPSGQLMRKSADERLYAAKRAGRNRVEP